MTGPKYVYLFFLYSLLNHCFCGVLKIGGMEFVHLHDVSSAFLVLQPLFGLQGLNVRSCTTHTLQFLPWKLCV